MSLPAVYLQLRMQFLERSVSALVQTMKHRHHGEADNLADLERVWQAEVGELHAALLRGDRSYFDQREQRLGKRRGA